MKENEAHIRNELLFEKHITVMKFGGSSVANAERILHAAEIVKESALTAPVVVVVSALQGVTDRLYAMTESLQSGQLDQVTSILDSLIRLHQAEAHIFGASDRLNAHLTHFKHDVLQLALSGCFEPWDKDLVVSYGERLSPLLFAEALKHLNKNSVAIDAGQIITTSGQFGNSIVDLKATRPKARAHLHPVMIKNSIPIIGGFYGMSRAGKLSILGRGGSDYTAAALANVLNAKELILWKEVDGVYSSDPKIDPGAEFYSELTYGAALSLAANGAKILHPEAMKPVAERQIPVYVRNTFKPELPGTKIYGGSK